MSLCVCVHHYVHLCVYVTVFALLCVYLHVCQYVCVPQHDREGMVSVEPVAISKHLGYPHFHIKGNSILKAYWADMP